MKTRNTSLNLLAFAALVASIGLTGSAPAATTVNVNFGNDPGDAMNGKSFIHDSGAGPYQQAPATYTGTTWNDYIRATIVSGNPTPDSAIRGTNVLDSAGNVTTIGFTTFPTSTPFSFDGPYSWFDHPDVKVLNGGVRRVFNSGSGNTLHNRLTISGLNTCKTYNLFLASSQNPNAKCYWQLGTAAAATGGILGITNTTTIRTAQTWVAGDNYVVFSGIAPDANGNIFVWGRGLAGSDGGTFSGITLNGFQIVDASGGVPSPEKNIFNFGLPIPGTSSTIDSTGTNITWTVLYTANLASLAPTFTVSGCASASPVSGSTQNFNSPVNYTVTAENGSTRIYRVIATNAPPSSAADILTFTLAGASSVIVGTNVTLLVPVGTVVTALAPTFTVSPFANAAPLSGTTRDFSGTVNYTVTAEDGVTTKTYAVRTLAANQWNTTAGNWSVGANWSPAVTPVSSATTALVFNNPGTYTSTHDLGALFQVNQISFGGSAVTLAGTSLQFAGTGAQVIQNSANPVIIGNALDLSVDTIFAGSGSGQVNTTGAISGNGRLTKATSGTLLLTGASSYNGGTTIQSGTIKPNRLGCFGTGPVTLAGGVIFNQSNEGGTGFEGNGPGGAYVNSFILSGGPVTFNVAFGGATDVWISQEVSGPGSIVVIGSGRNQGLTLQGNNTFQGGLTLGLPGSVDTCNVQLFNTNSLGSGTLRTELTGSDFSKGGLRIQGDLSSGVSNTIDLATGARLVVNTKPQGAGPNPVLFTGSITNGGSLVKSGDGIMALSGTNTYRGTTTVSGGVLQIRNPASLGTNRLDIKLNNYGGEAPASVAQVDLLYAGTRIIGAMTIDDVVKPNGVYGSTASGAANVDDVHFTGPGTITVGPPAQFVITSAIYNTLNDQLTLTWNSTPGAIYTVENTQQFEGNGAGTSWDNLITGIPSGGPTTTFVIDAPYPGTYYRIRKE